MPDPQQATPTEAFDYRACMGANSGDAIHVVRIGPAETAAVHAAAACFDHQPLPAATERFLRTPGHHLLIADIDGEPAGMITGVELTHPDKGTEMFLYELGVSDQFRNRGIGRTLVRALADLAIKLGCYGMWVLTDDDNRAAVRTYTAAGGTIREQTRLIGWDFPGPA